MTNYHKPSSLAASMLDPDPLAPETTVYWDQSTGAQQPGAGGPVVASRIWYDNTMSALQVDNVQDALDLIDNQLDNITGASASLDARVDALEAEMDTAQADIITLQGRMTTVEGNIVDLQAADTNLQSEIDALDVRLDAAEATITVHTADIAALDTRLDAVEAKNVTQDGRLDAVEAKNVTQDGRLDAVEAKNVTQDGRLTTLEGKTGQATETTAGIAEIATTVEVNAGTDDARVITPLKLAARLSSFIPSVPQATETILGGGEIATQAEVNAGTDDARIVTALKLAARLAAFGTAYVLKTGDTMTGDLQISKNSPAFLLNVPAAGGDAFHQWRVAGVARAQLGWTQNGDAVYLNYNTAAGAFQRTGIWVNSIGVGIGGGGINYPLELVGLPAQDAWVCATGQSNKNAGFVWRNGQHFYGWSVDAGGRCLLNDFSAGTVPVRVDTAGSVGIGIDPASKLHVYQSDFCQHVVQSASTQARTAWQNQSRVWCAGNLDNEFQVWDLTASVKRLAIDTAGKTYALGPLAVSGDLTCQHLSTGAYQIWTNRTRGGVGDAGVLKCWGTENNVCFRWDGLLRYRIDEALDAAIVYTATDLRNIQIANHGSSPTGKAFYAEQAGTGYYSFCDVTSDPRLKREIAPSKVDALAVINAIDAIEFHWDAEACKAFKQDETDAFVPLGVNAAQLREIIPEMVTEDMAGLLRVNLKQGVPWLIKAVQQLSARVAELEKRHGY